MIGQHDVNHISTYCVIFSYGELMNIFRIVNEKYVKLWRELDEQRKNIDEPIDLDKSRECEELKQLVDGIGSVFVEEDTG